MTQFLRSGDDAITVHGYDPGTAPNYDDTTQMKAIAYCGSTVAADAAGSNA